MGLPKLFKVLRLHLHGDHSTIRVHAEGERTLPGLQHHGPDDRAFQVRGDAEGQKGIVSAMHLPLTFLRVSTELPDIKTQLDGFPCQSCCLHTYPDEQVSIPRLLT